MKEMISSKLAQEMMEVSIDEDHLKIMEEYEERVKIIEARHEQARIDQMKSLQYKLDRRKRGESSYLKVCLLNLQSIL